MSADTTTTPGGAPTLTPETTSTERPFIGATATVEETDDTAIRPFQFHASDEELAELKRRILATRWPERESVDDGTQGVQLALMQKLADYWANDYNWRRCEARLNALPP